MDPKYRWAIAALVALVAVIGIIVAATSGDDDDTAAEATPTAEPTEEPTEEPTAEPTEEPTAEPTEEPTEEPTAEPTEEPTEEPTAEPTEEPTEEPTAGPEPVRGEILESSVGSELSQHSGDPLAGPVSVSWNNGSNGNLIAVYYGDGMADLTGLCPGNSIQVGDDFDLISNTPAAPGACDGFPTDRASLRVCTSAVVLYETLIPNNSEGVLWGSLEWNSDEGIVGMTSQSVNAPDTPEINYDADVYDISPMFTNDGATEIACEDPVS